MSKDTVLTGVLIEETTTYTLVDVCTRYHIPKELVQEMVEQGMFDLQSADAQHVVLRPRDLHKIESAFRLHKDLGINLPGVALALDLLDQLDDLHKELDILRRHF